MKRIIIIAAYLFPFIGFGQVAFVVPVVPTSGIVLDSVNWAFSKTAHNPLATWTAVTGNPCVGVVTSTVGNYSLTTVATANWPSFTGPSCSYDALGRLGSTFYPDSVFFNAFFVYSGASNTADSAVLGLGKPQFIVTVPAGGTYTVTVGGAINPALAGFSCTNKYRILGSTMFISPLIDDQQNPASGFIQTGVHPDGSNHITFYINTQPGNEAGLMSGIKIKRTS